MPDGAERRNAARPCPEIVAMQGRSAGSGSKAPPRDGRLIEVAVSPGELIDKVSILEIKAARIGDPDKLKSVARALELLQETRRRCLPPSDALTRLEAELKQTNEALWDIEDAIRACEAAGDFGPRFVELARSVYKTNDRRAAAKKRIDLLFGSEISDEKSYQHY
jgi:hypothetical protein